MNTTSTALSIPTAGDLYRAAQTYMAAGQPVFPCKSSGEKAKAPLGSVVPNGLHDASLDRAVVKNWWRNNRTASLGIPTGIVWDVLDVDIKVKDDGTKVDGRVHLPYLTRLGLLNGCKELVRTPSGGWHLYFKATPGLTNKARGASLGLDVRALGGYVLAPPSYIQTNTYAGHYTSLGETTGSTNEPLYWDLIVSALTPMDTVANKPVELLRVERQSNVASLRQWLAEREHGERNNALHWAVCRCIDNGIDPHEMVEPALLIGLDEDEVLLTVRSALKRVGLSADDLDTEVDAMFPDLDWSEYDELEGAA